MRVGVTVKVGASLGVSIRAGDSDNVQYAVGVMVMIYMVLALTGLVIVTMSGSRLGPGRRVPLGLWLGRRVPLGLWLRLRLELGLRLGLRLELGL